MSTYPAAPWTMDGQLWLSLFRLGHDVPRQLSNSEVGHVYDSVQAAMSGAPQDSARRAARLIVARRNSALRRDFEQARIDTRLARSLELEYRHAFAARRTGRRKPARRSDDRL